MHNDDMCIYNIQIIFYSYNLLFLINSNLKLKKKNTFCFPTLFSYAAFQNILNQIVFFYCIFYSIFLRLLHYFLHHLNYHLRYLLHLHRFHRFLHRKYLQIPVQFFVLCLVQTVKLLFLFVFHCRHS